MTVPEKLFKVTLHLAKYTNLNVFEIRKIEFDEIVYLYNALIKYDFDDFDDVNADTPVPKKSGGRQVYADQVDWFD